MVSAAFASAGPTCEFSAAHPTVAVSASASAAASRRGCIVRSFCWAMGGMITRTAESFRRAGLDPPARLRRGGPRPALHSRAANRLGQRYRLAGRRIGPHQHRATVAVKLPRIARVHDAMADRDRGIAEPFAREL